MACSGSAQALRPATLAVEDGAVLARLRAANVERVGLFEARARCLAAGTTASQRVMQLASGLEPETPLTATDARVRVSLAQCGFEQAVAALGRPRDDDGGRLAELARRQLAGARSLRRGGAQQRARSAGTAVWTVLRPRLAIPAPGM